MPEKFVILSMPRSGTGYVYTMLNSHPDLVVHGELFKPKGIGAVSGKLHDDRKLVREWLQFDYRQSDPIGFLDKALDYDDKVELAGFKLFFPQNDVVLEHVTSLPEFKKIHLVRENILAMYSSARTAQATGQGKVLKGEKPKKVKIDFDIDDYEYFKARRDKYVSHGLDLLKANNQDYLEIEYTDLSRQDNFVKILEFLGVDTAVSLTTGVEKRNSSNILDRFNNPDIVVEYMSNLGNLNWLEEAF